MSDTSDWEHLTLSQQKDVDAVRDRMSRHLIAEQEWFYGQHPELRLTWSFTCDVLRRDRHPVQMQEL